MASSSKAYGRSLRYTRCPQLFSTWSWMKWCATGYIWCCTGGMYGWGREVLHRAAFLCTDDSLGTSTDPDWLKGAFDALTWLLDSLWLQTYVVKKVGIIYRPFRTVVTQSEAAYNQWMTVEVLNYWSRQCLFVKFPDCGEDLVVGSLASHCQTHRGIGLGYQLDTPAGETYTYRISFPIAAGPQD